MKMRGVWVAAAAVGVLGLVGACGSDAKPEPTERPSEGPEYEAAMERCALSRLRNAGVEDASTESRDYLDARTACTYGRSFDDVTGPGRGWGAADPGYWDD
ncbi:hypothetical protein [Streptomyces ardesiacus]|uniref:hypothetical protein n=1 Tax=Streptomyces ardesiacus TaxID=285564 RepID=UPI00131F3648|nr:hypothetical protein [Streptomyces ardesiacus]